jgi:hypothetical protein
MEPKDVFADDVRNRSRVAPELVEEWLFTFFRGAAECADVVRERVEPHVDHVLRVAWDWDAPSKARARDR